MDVVFNKDGTMYSISNDTDFCRMLSECLGDDAAVWYQGRIGRVDELNREMRQMMPSEDKLVRKLPSGRPVYDFNALAAIGTDRLLDIATIAYEIPGWDE